MLRLPVLLYRLHLGWLLGHRCLLLTHRGQRTGQIHQTVLEVISYRPHTRECIVAAGWGTQAAWYRNLLAQPALAITVAREHYVPEQRVLGAAEARVVLEAYVRRHRLATWLGRHLLGLSIDEGAPLPMLAFRPSRFSSSDG